MRARQPIVGLASLLVLGCSPDTTYVDDGNNETESGSSSSSESESESGEPTTSESETDTGSETETGDPGPYCGDGTLDPGEECDDNNDVDDDGCSVECKSDCGIEYWVDITVEPGRWFNVHAMESRPVGRVLIAGEVTEDNMPGSLRVIGMDDSSMIDGVIEGPPLGSAGTVQLPQTHQVNALTLTANDDVVAIGTSTEVLVMGEAPVVTYWLGRFAAADLTEQWRIDIPATEAERPLDVAVLANGDAILTMTKIVAPDDHDIGFERRSGTDGSVVWTSSHTGAFDGGWSLDDAGLVAVVEGDRVWGAGIVRVNWQTFETTLIELDPDDGMVLWTDVPLPDPGNVHEQRVYELTAGPAGTVAVGINVLGAASPYNFGGAYLYADQQLSWSLIPDDLPWEDGTPYVSPRISIDSDGDALVAGTYTHDFEVSTASRTWVVGMAPDGTQLCAARVGQGSDAAIVPRNGFFDGGRGALNLDTYGPGGMGPGSDGNWIAGIRGW